MLLEYFGEPLAEPCGNCDTCLEPAETFDGTEVARKALSCVYRTGQSFGAGHVIDVLTGGDTERVRRFNHDRLSTYGIGRDMSRADWRSVFRQLVAHGLLTVDVEGHGGLHLAPDSRPVLRGERTIALRRDPARKTPASRRPGRRTAAALFERAEDAALFDRLRACRLELAQTQGVPPYVIFHDSTLTEMALQRPRTLADLARLPGIGEAKLNRYGAAFLAALSSTAEDPAVVRRAG